MTSSEFVVILAWVLFPPPAIAVAVLIALHRMAEGRKASRTVEAAVEAVEIHANVNAEVGVSTRSSD